MALFPKDIYIALKATLEVSSYLGYVDKVSIRKYRRSNLPDFDYYCIVISPSSAESVIYPASQRWIENTIELILLGKVLQGENDAVMADSSGASPPNVGILAMYEDVFRTLYENTLGGELELLPGLDELDVPVRFDIIEDEEREAFIVETRMLYKPRGKRFVNLA